MTTPEDRRAAAELATIIFGNGHSLTEQLRTMPRHFMLDAFHTHAEAARIAERERVQPRWVFPKSLADMPAKPGKQAYEYVECLIMRRGEFMMRPWNCEHQVFDDEEHDDHFCEWHEVKAYIDLTAILATAIEQGAHHE